MVIGIVMIFIKGVFACQIIAIAAVEIGIAMLSPYFFYFVGKPIAKLFENSIREDTLLTEAYGGLIFMEGSAGTLQEIFQEAVQNHYVSLGYPSPMIFVGKQFWTEEVPVVPFMQHMLDNGRYKNLLLHVADSVDEIVESIITN